MELSVVTKNVFHVKAETQYDLASTFMRVQEFYESPFEGIRGHFFTHEQYMDTHVRSNKRSSTEEIKFTYLEDWEGFNVPGNVFNKWTTLFSRHGLWDKEQELVDLVHGELKSKTNKFYVIGTYEEEAADKSVIDHELSHAWFYLDPKYKKEMLKLVRKFPKAAKTQLKLDLKEEGYDPSVFDDEIIAYMSTNPMTYTKKMFKKKPIPWEKILEFQEQFSNFKEEKLDKTD